MSAITGLSPITSELENKSAYVNLFSNKHMTIDFILSKLSIKQTSVLISFISKESLSLGLNASTNNKFNALSSNPLQKSYFINRNSQKKTIDSINLIKDIHKINIPKQLDIFILIPDSFLSHNNGREIDEFLQSVNSLASKNDAKLNLCIYGSLATAILKPKLLSHNRLIAGLATMTAIDHSRYSYLVDFWSNRHGVIAAQEYIFTKQNDGHFVATQQTRQKTQQITEDKSDSDRIYVSRQAIGEREKITKAMHVADNNQHLLSLLDAPRASTIIFSCSNQDEVQQLALDCYQLRAQAGPQLKIIIRETQQCLRYADEKFLLRAGVNLICPVQVPHMRFITQVEAVQGQVLSREIPKNLDTLLKYDLKFGSKGYLNGNEFTHYCSEIMSTSAQSKVHFALVKLNLLPGMQAEECLRLCHIKRDGDVVTASSKALYVLFSAIRHSDIGIALNNIFEFPVRDLFHSTHTFETQYDIDSELKHILDDQAAISNEVTDLTIEREIFSANQQPLTAMPALFAVRKNIALKRP